jgi:hypothetical protein
MNGVKKEAMAVTKRTTPLLTGARGRSGALGSLKLMGPPFPKP